MHRKQQSTSNVFKLILAVIAICCCVVSRGTAAQACSYVLSPVDLSNFPAAGGAATIAVTAAGGCPVTATSFQPWVTVVSIVPNGSITTVSLQIGANTDGFRGTSILLADRLFLITQLGVQNTFVIVPTLDNWVIFVLALSLAAIAGVALQRRALTTRSRGRAGEGRRLVARWWRRAP